MQKAHTFVSTAHLKRGYTKLGYDYILSQNLLVHCAMVYLFTNLALHEDIPPSATASFPAVTGPTLNTGQVPQDQQLNALQTGSTNCLPSNTPS